MLPGISSLLRIIPQVLKNGKTRFLLIHSLLIHSLPFSHSLNPDRVFRIRGLIPLNLRVAGGGNPTAIRTVLELVDERSHRFHRVVETDQPG